MGLTFTEAFGREVFMVCGSGETEEELFLTDDWDDLQAHLRNLSISLDEPPKVLHGYVSSAEFIPANPPLKNIHVIYSEDNFKTGYVIEPGTDDVDSLAQEIESVITASVSSGMLGHAPTIDDVYIFYGYELQVVFSVNDDLVDDEIAETCKGIVSQVNLLRSWTI
jgi:hypothetical protein